MTMSLRNVVVLAVCVLGAVGLDSSKPREFNKPPEVVSWKMLPKEPLQTRSAKPDLVHKFAWALPGVLGRDLISRLEHFGYDQSPVAAHTVPARLNLDGGHGASTSLLEKGRKTLSVHQRVHEVTAKEVQDAKHGIEFFVLERARRQVDGHDVESSIKIIDATTRLLDKAQAHMEQLGTLRVINPQ